MWRVSRPAVQRPRSWQPPILIFLPPSTSILGWHAGAARDMPSAFAAMGGSGTIRPRGEGRTVPTIVFHGDADRTVNPVNSDQVIAQASQETALTKMVTHGETPGGMAYTRTVQLDAAGGEVLEQWILHGAGRAWSGGSASGSYTDARGPDASREMVRFFLAHASAKAATSISGAKSAQSMTEWRRRVRRYGGWRLPYALFLGRGAPRRRAMT
jgi:hypothetical protein